MEEIHKVCQRHHIKISVHNERITLEGIIKDVYLAKDTIHELLRQWHRKMWTEKEIKIRSSEGQFM